MSEPRKSDTPRTDAFIEEYRIKIPIYARDYEAVYESHARQLERELNAAKDRCEKLERYMVACSKCGTALRLRDTRSRLLKKYSDQLLRTRYWSDRAEDAEEHLAKESKGTRVLFDKLQEAEEKIENQAKRIKYLEGATNHASGTPLSKAEERIKELEMQLADAKVKHAGVCGTSCAQADAIEALEAQLAEAKKDSERLDWVLNLYDKQGQIDGLDFGEVMDRAAIDAARAENEKADPTAKSDRPKPKL